MDITLQIITIPPSHVLPTGEDSRRYRQGDVVCVWDSTRVALYDDAEYRLRDLIATPRFVFIHVLGAPFATVGAAQELFTRAYTDADIAVVVDKRGEILRRRLWHLDVALMPAPILARLIKDREMTTRWSDISSVIRRRIDGAQLTIGM